MSIPGLVSSRIAAALLLSVCALVGCGGDGTPGESGDALEANAEVVRVVDGDTIIVLMDGAEERVRLIGINTPESVDPRRPVMCFGKEAATELGEILAEGAGIRLERDVEPRDRYDRLLAYVYRSSDALFVNLEMVERGYAQQYTYPPNVAHTDEFRAAERAARTTEQGAWGGCEDPFEE